MTYINPPFRSPVRENETFRSPVRENEISGSGGDSSADGFGSGRPSNNEGGIGGTKKPVATGIDNPFPDDCGRDADTGTGLLCFPDGKLCQESKHSYFSGVMLCGNQSISGSKSTNKICDDCARFSKL